MDNILFYEKNNKKNIIVGKTGNFSYYYAWLLKNIEKGGGFDKFVNIFASQPNVEEIYTIFTILFYSLDYIHSKYIIENKDVFNNIFFEYYNSLDDKGIKNLS